LAHSFIPFYGFILVKKENTRLWKLGKILPSLIKNFEDCINPGEYLCVDESLLSFKGRLSFKQYMPLKRSRFGFKYFALVDCEMKFLTKLRVYLGKSSNNNTIKKFGIGGSTVLLLLDESIGRNHKLIIDNCFNSPLLQYYLTEHLSKLKLEKIHV